MQYPTKENLYQFKPDFSDLVKAGVSLILLSGYAYVAFYFVERGSGFWSSLVAFLLIFTGVWAVFFALAIAWIFLKELLGYLEYKTNPLGFAQQKHREEQKRIQKEERKNELLRSKKYWSSMSGFVFEEQFCAILQEHGIRASLTPRTADGGVDIWVYTSRGKAAIQCKSYKNQAGPAPVRELYGVVQSTKAQFGLLVCTSGFSSGAKEFGRKHGVKLAGIDDIVDIAEGTSGLLERLR